MSGRRLLGSTAALALLLLAAAPPAATAQTRTWRNSDGSSSFPGEYLGHDQRRVRIRRHDGRVFTLDLDRLHADDRAWLAARDNTTGPAAAPAPLVPDETAVFDTLRLGDLHREVSAKLDASEVVELAVARTFLGRLGLNGTYRTRHQIGGQHCLLFFDWTNGEDGRRMRELSLQTEPRDSTSYSTRLKATWQEFSKLLTTLHGKPLQAADLPPIHDLAADGMFLASHLWRLENGHCALLGTSREGGRYSVIVRFTTDSIEPVRK